MTEGAKTKKPVSLDALLSANRESFDTLFRHQMSGGRVASARKAPAEPGPETEAPSAAIAEQEMEGDAGNIVAELNRRFTTTWSSEVLDHDVRDGRVIVQCKLTVGDQTRTESGSSRIREDADEETAFQRAFDRALKKCADGFADAERPSGLLPSEQMAPISLPGPAERSAVQARPIDAVTINLVETALLNVRREMETVLARSALSPVLRSGPVQAAMIMDSHGHMIAGQYGSYVAHMLTAQKLHLSPGDVLLQSDPHTSGGAAGHLSDWLVLLPIFHGSEQVGFASVHGHMTDVGGTAGGSTPADASSIFAEGIRIPPVKIYEAGILNAAALDVILANSRTPDSNRADLMALVAACRAGESQVIRLCDRLGPELYHRSCAALLERTEEAMRQRIVETIPEEPQSFEDQIDDDGCGNGPFKLRLTVWREGDHAYFDWTGTFAQAPGPVNFLMHVGLAKMFVGRYLMRAFGPEIPCNDGYYDLIHVTLPKGSLLNPDFPAAVGRSEHALTRQLEVLGSAVDRHAPERLSAAGNGSQPSFVYAGAGFRMTDPVFGGLPASREGDGMDGHARWHGEETVPAEDLEGAFPVVIESCASVPDSGGAGLYRGGNGVEKIYRVLEEGRVSIHDDRHESRPWGVRGGKPGGRSEKWIERADGAREALPSKIEGLAVMPGDRIIFRTAGGGGYGDPLERDPMLVRRDVAFGFLTAEAAGSRYGVILEGPILDVDRRATEELRAGLMRERKDVKLFDRGENA